MAAMGREPSGRAGMVSGHRVALVLSFIPDDPWEVANGIRLCLTPEEIGLRLWGRGEVQTVCFGERRLWGRGA